MAENGQATPTMQTLAWQSVVQALAGLGLTFEGQRNLYTALGWKTALTPQDFVNKYIRQDIAGRIVDIFPDYTWRQAPRITDDQDADPVTPFEAAYTTLATRLRLPSVWQTLDRLMGMGHYAVLVLGTNDGQRLESPLTRARQVLYLSPYGEVHAEINAWNGEETSPRFLKPELYTIQMNRGRSGLLTPSSRLAGLTIPVHWSRVIHVAEQSFDGGTIGTPRLERVYNRLDDLEKLLGGSAEMFWQAGRGQIVAALREGAQPPEGEDKATLLREFDEFIHGLSQLMRVRGMDVSRLEAAVASPRDAVNAQRTILATAVGCPQRILFGSERGELASSQDQLEWRATITGRQVNTAEPVFVRQTVDRFVDIGILPEPRQGQYEVIWPQSEAIDPVRQAEVAERTARAVAAYLDSGAERLIPQPEFREHYLGLAAMQDGVRLASEPGTEDGRVSNAA